MIDSRCHSGANDGRVIDHFSEVGEKLREFEACATVLCEFEGTRHQFGRPANSALSDRYWYRLPVVFGQSRFGIEQIHLARTTSHVEKNNVASAWLKLWAFGKQVETL